ALCVAVISPANNGAVLFQGQRMERTRGNFRGACQTERQVGLSEGVITPNNDLSIAPQAERVRDTGGDLDQVADIVRDVGWLSNESPFHGTGPISEQGHCVITGGGDLNCRRELLKKSCLPGAVIAPTQPGRLCGALVWRNQSRCEHPDGEY